MRMSKIIELKSKSILYTTLGYYLTTGRSYILRVLGPEKARTVGNFYLHESN
jgi:hypothetical protein